MNHKLNAGLVTLLIAYLAFIILGIPEGLLNVGWPSIRDEFGVGNDTLGVLLGVAILGYMIASSSSGRVIARLGMGRALVVSGIVRVAGLLGYALAPVWGLMVGFGALNGAGGGVIDAGLNTYVAANYSARYMNWLHASFGVGATLGPLVMTGALNATGSWRWGYAAVGVAQVVVIGTIALTRRQWREAPKTAQAEPAALARARDTLRLPVAWLGVALFFMAAGLEVLTAQWTYTLFTEGRGVATDTAGFWTSIYWGSFTVGRILAGFIVARIGSIRLLRIAMTSAVIGAIMIWLNLSNALSFAGLALMGFAIAPMFPLMISLTPGRIGLAHAPNAIGFQVSAAGLGIAILPGLAGVLVERMSLEVVGPYIVVAAVLLLVLHEFVLLRERRAQPVTVEA